MSRIEELFQDIAEEFARGNRQEREYSRSEIDTSDLIKDDALLLSTLAGLGTAPVAGPAWLANFTSRAAAPLNKMYGAVGGDMSKMIIPPLSKVGRRFRNQDTPSSSGARVGQDAKQEIIPPLTKTGQRTTNRGPRGNTNIDQPVQRNLDLSDLKPTGIQNTTQARGMNPRMRKDLETRQRTIDAELYDLDRRSKDGMEIDLDKVMRLRDELTALTKTLTD